MIYVIAANRQHFVRWCNMSGIHPNDIKRVRYVDDWRKLWGVDGKNCEFIFYETWREHPDAYKILQEVRLIRERASIKPVPTLVSVPAIVRSKSVFTWTFWKSALERCIRAGATMALTLIGADATDLLSSNWGDKLPMIISATLISLLTSIVAGTVVGKKGDPSLVETE